MSKNKLVVVVAGERRDRSFDPFFLSLSAFILPLSDARRRDFRVDSDDEDIVAQLRDYCRDSRNIIVLRDPRE